jgi:hypothetical protein
MMPTRTRSGAENAALSCAVKLAGTTAAANGSAAAERKSLRLIFECLLISGSSLMGLHLMKAAELITG